jgi:hypothetical protein
VEHRLDLVGTVCNLSIEFLTTIFRLVGVLGIKVQFVFADIGPDNKKILSVDFLSYFGYVEHRKPPFLVNEFACLFAGKVRLPFLFCNSVSPKVRPSGCEYVALAQHLDVRLVTGDTQVVDRFPDTAVLLEEFAGSQDA